MKTTALSVLTGLETMPETGLPDRPVVFDPKVAGVCDLLTPADFDRYLVDHGPRVPSFAASLRSKPAPASSITNQLTRTEVDLRDTADPLGILEAIEAGYSTSLHNLNGFAGPIRSFCQELSSELYAPVLASAFFSPAGGQALAHHHDTVSVFLCQTYGSKHWNLYRPVVPNPLDHQQWSWARITDDDRARLVDGPPDFECNLSAGQVLWIPRGWVHEGLAQETASLHLTVRVEGIDENWVAHEVMRWLGDAVGLRKDMPAQFGRDFDESSAVLVRYLDKLQNLLRNVVQTDLTEHVLSRQRERFIPAAVHPVSDVILAEVVTGDTQLAVTESAIVGFDIWEDSTARLHLGTAEHSVDAQQAELLRATLASQENTFPASVWFDKLGEDAGRRAILRLIAVGVMRRAASGL